MDSPDYASVNRGFEKLAQLAETGPLWDKTVNDRGEIVKLQGLDRFFAWFMQTDESALWSISAKLISKVPAGENRAITQRLRAKGLTKEGRATKNWKAQAKILADVIQFSYHSSALAQAESELGVLQGRVTRYQSPDSTRGDLQAIRDLLNRMPEEMPEELQEKAARVHNVATKTLQVMNGLLPIEQLLQKTHEQMHLRTDPMAIGRELDKIEQELEVQRRTLNSIVEEPLRNAVRGHIDDLARALTVAKQDLAAVQHVHQSFEALLAHGEKPLEALFQDIENAKNSLEEYFPTMSAKLHQQLRADLQKEMQAAQQVLAAQWQSRIETFKEIPNLADRLKTCNEELLLIERGRAALGDGSEVVQAQLKALQEMTQRATGEAAQRIRKEAERQVTQMKDPTSEENLDSNSAKIAEMRSQLRPLREAVQHLPYDQQNGVRADIEQADHAFQAAAIDVYRCTIENWVGRALAGKTIESAAGDLQKTGRGLGSPIGKLRALRKEAQTLPQSVKTESLARLNQLEQQVRVKQTVLEAMHPLQEALLKSQGDLLRLQPTLESGAFCGALTRTLLSLDAARKRHATLPGEGTTWRAEAGEALNSLEPQIFAKARDHLQQLTQELGARSSRELDAQLGQLATLQKGLTRLAEQFPAYAERLGQIQQGVTATQTQLVKQLQAVVSQTLKGGSALVIRATQPFAFHAPEFDLTKELEAFDSAQKELEHLQKLAHIYDLDTSETFDELPEQLKVRHIATKAESWARELEKNLAAGDLTTLTSGARALGKLLSRHQKKLQDLSSNHYKKLVAKYNAILGKMEERRAQMQEAQLQAFVTSPEGIAVQALLPQLVATAVYSAPSRVDKSRLPKEERSKLSRAEKRQWKGEVAGLRAQQKQTRRAGKTGRK